MSSPQELLSYRPEKLIIMEHNKLLNLTQWKCHTHLFCDFLPPKRTSSLRREKWGSWLVKPSIIYKKKKKKESEEEKDSLKSIKTKIGYDYDWILSIIRFTYQVSIQTIKAVSCVWVMTRFGVLRANELHDLVLSFTRGLWWNGNQKNFTETHTRHKALKSSNSPHDQTNTRSLPAMICLWTVYCEQNI